MAGIANKVYFLFSQVSCLERGQKITDQSNFVNDVTSFYAGFSGGNLRELKQQRWRQLQKHHLKCVFGLLQADFSSFSSSRDCIEVQEKKKKVAVLFSPSIKGLFHVEVVQ